MIVIPTEDRILVKVKEKEEKSIGGVMIPETAKEKPTLGDVLEVGEGVTEVKKGDRILYGKYSGTKIEIEEINYLLLRKADVFAIIK